MAVTHPINARVEAMVVACAVVFVGCASPDPIPRDTSVSEQEAAPPDGEAPPVRRSATHGDDPLDAEQLKKNLTGKKGKPGKGTYSDPSDGGNDGGEPVAIDPSEKIENAKVCADAGDDCSSITDSVCAVRRDSKGAVLSAVCKCPADLPERISAGDDPSPERDSNGKRAARCVAVDCPAENLRFKTKTDGRPDYAQCICPFSTDEAMSLGDCSFAVDVRTAVIAGDALKLKLNKPVEECVDIYINGTRASSGDLFCEKGYHEKDLPLASLKTSVKSGDKLTLCSKREARLCSNATALRKGVAPSCTAHMDTNVPERGVLLDFRAVCTDADANFDYVLITFLGASGSPLGLCRQASAASSVTCSFKEKFSQSAGRSQSVQMCGIDKDGLQGCATTSFNLANNY